MSVTDAEIDAAAADLFAGGLWPIAYPAGPEVDRNEAWAMLLDDEQKQRLRAAAASALAAAHAVRHPRSGED